MRGQEQERSRIAQDLHDEVNQALTAILLRNQVRVHEKKLYDRLDQTRSTIPEQIKQARWIVKEREEIVTEAKHKAERILEEARERQTQLVSRKSSFARACGAGHR